MKHWVLKIMLPLLSITVLATAGCQRDNTEDGTGNNPAVSERLATLEAQIANMENAVKSLEAVYKTADAEIKEELEKQIDELRKMLEGTDGSENVDISGKIAALEAEVDACIEAMSGLSASISGMQSQIDAMRSAVDRKVEQSVYDDFVRQTNEQMQINAALLSELLAMCNGFNGGSIKEYIDTAVANVVSMLDGYVLKNTYEKFVSEYGEFKTGVNGQLESNNAKIAALEQEMKVLEELLESGGSGSIGDLSSLTKSIADLQVRIQKLESDSVKLEEVKAMFDKQNADFFNAVNDMLSDALSNDGLISLAIAQSADTLRNEYTAEIESLKARLDALEGKVADLISRIQSLVYVPKTSDGKIHIGTTYIAETDSDGNEIGARIEVTPTKKLEYRVSPADLRDYLLELPASCFSFYQEHVTRATIEGSGMDEFHIVKIEEGNGPGEILITVDNEHDFTHEDLAVALCIKHTSDNGVITEFTSPYTTVIGEGRNIRDRFYLAKRHDDSWAISRDDNISYLIKYNDTATTVALFADSEYEVVYDNGESVMTLAEAKERFEWQVDLQSSTEGIPDGFVNNLFVGTSSVTPTNPNADRTKPVTVKLQVLATSNLRKRVSDKYRVYLSDGENKITLIPEVNVSLTVIGAAYTVDAGAFDWNFSTWYSGRNNGSTSYQTDYCTIRSTVSGSGNDADLSHFPDSDMNEMFPRNAEWTVKQGSDITGAVTAASGPVRSDGNSRQLQFTVGGYLYNEGSTSITLSRKVKPSSMVGPDGIEFTATIDISAPETRTAYINRPSVSADAAQDYMFYFTLSDYIPAKEKMLNYTDEEITRYFGTNSNASTMLMLGAPNSVEGWRSDDGNYTLPVKKEYGRNTETGSYAVVDCLVAYPVQITPAPPVGTTVFTAPEGYSWVVPNGPTIPVKGSISISKAQ